MAALHLLVIVFFLVVVAVVQVQLAVASAPVARAPSSSYRCGWCPRRSTASLLAPDALTGAACGYAPELLAEGGFHIAAVSAGLFRNGQACGACCELRCRDRTACTEEGVKIVVVADVPVTNVTGGGGDGRFMLTSDAFATMMTNHDDDRLASFDATVDVEFRRVPCVYRDKNLSVKVEETSARDSGRLALRFLYQAGQTEIAAVEVAQAATNNDAAPSAASMWRWRYMTRREGSAGVWRTSRAPAGPLRLRIVVTAGSGGKWLSSDGAALPAEWVPGGVYDTRLRVADVAASTCGGASCTTTDGDDEDGDEELR